MSVVAATGGYHIVKPPQYVEEYVYSTIPAAASMSWIGIVDGFSPTADMKPIEFRKVGSEDLTAQVKGPEEYTVAIDYSIQNTNFLKYGMQAQGGGTQTPDNSLTLLTSLRLNNVENYILALGSRVHSIKVTGKVGEGHKVSAEIYSAEITSASTGLGVTPVYTSDPGTTPWVFSDGGTAPVQVGALAAIGLPATEIDVTVTRNLERIWTLGGTKVQYLPAKHREIKGSFTLVWTSSDPYVDLKDFNTQSMRWIMKSSSSIELGNVNYTKLDSFTLKPTEVVYEKYSFTARTLSVSG